MGLLRNLIKLGVGVLFAKFLKPSEPEPEAIQCILHIGGSHQCTTVVLEKEDQCYVFKFDNKDIAILLQTLGRHAADPELSFSWQDAAYISKTIRELEYRK